MHPNKLSKTSIKKRTEHIQVDKSASAVILAVEEGSPADYAGLSAGCIISHVNGNTLRDIIDWRWYASDDSIEISGIDRDGDEFDIILEREYQEDWGITFTEAIFDGIKICRNNCVFCFMRQLPSGVRESLVLRDDDYRLSFLSGNFVTLTNLDDSDISRIVEQHLSPLKVSLHATNSDVRNRLIGKHAGLGLSNLEKLLEAGIEIDCQIVLVPGLNDGSILTDTLEWAYQHAGIRNIGIVPVGYTAHQSKLERGFNDQADALDVICTVNLFQAKALTERGYPFVYLADEFYRSAYGDDILKHIPPAEHYGDYEMFEDGIGIIRSMVDDLQIAINDCDESFWPDDCVVNYVCGHAMISHFALALKSSKLSNKLKALPVHNKWLGGNVNVTGLLAGSDIIEEILTHHKLPIDSNKCSYYAIPDIIFNDDNLTLDGLTIADIINALSTHSDSSIASRVFVVSSNPLDYIPEIFEHLKLL